MFKELMPLLSQRMVIIALLRVNDDEMCINIIPKPLKSDQPDDGAALTTPLSLTGTPKELDEQLPGQLLEFVEAHLGLSSTLKSAKEHLGATRRLVTSPRRRPGRSSNSLCSFRLRQVYPRRTVLAR